jgi:predicted membrane chloride channel (bestrophin family)
MKVIQSLRLIFRPNTIVVSILSIIVTYICIVYEKYADFPLTLIGLAVVFPIVFSISGAYARREKALNYYGTLKAHGRAIYFVARDWDFESDKQHLDKLKYILRGLLGGLRHMFMMEIDESEEKEKFVYKKFSELSMYLKERHEQGMSPSILSRANSYMSKMLDSFESMKHIYQYRTPVTLRAYSKIFVYVLPIVYGLYFANLAQSIPIELFFVVPLLFSITLVSLDNIQDHLENPFDMVGEDDVEINEVKFTKWLEL